MNADRRSEIAKRGLRSARDKRRRAEAAEISEVRLALRYGLSWREIAAALDLPLATVYRRHHVDDGAPL